MSLLIHLTEAISEKKRDALYAIFNKTFPTNVKQEYQYIVDDTFELILTLDPTPNNQYTQWLITKGIPSVSRYLFRLNSTSIIPDDDRLTEDEPRIKDALQTHFNVKQRRGFPQQYKDINKIKSFKELYEVIKPYQTKLEDSIEDIIERSGIKLNEDYVVLYESNNVTIFIPETEKASCVIGAKTDWCTTWGVESLNSDYKGRDNYFDRHKYDHDSLNDLYIIYLKGNEEFYQLHFATQQYMDAKDNAVELQSILDKIGHDATVALYVDVLEKIPHHPHLKVKGGSYFLHFDDINELVEYFVYGVHESDKNDYDKIVPYLFDKIEYDFRIYPRYVEKSVMFSLFDKKSDKINARDFDNLISFFENENEIHSYSFNELYDKYLDFIDDDLGEYDEDED